jgi:hypothetical protein
VTGIPQAAIDDAMTAIATRHDVLARGFEELLGDGPVP